MPHNFGKLKLTSGERTDEKGRKYRERFVIKDGAVVNGGTDEDYWIWPETPAEFRGDEKSRRTQ